MRDAFAHDLELSVLADARELTDVAAALVVERAKAAIAARGRFLWCLSGGSTPRALYSRLASEPWNRRVDWAHVHVAWGDERAVPPEDDASNYRMAREALLAHVAVPARQVHRIRSELDPASAAAGYEQILRGLLGEADGASPITGFDLVLLGLGVDGHTASLFPGRPAVHEAKRWVVADKIDPTGAWRITLTPLCLNAADSILFLVAGAGKADAVRAAVQGPSTPDTAPSRAIRPRNGRAHWLVDAGAASGLSTPG